MDDCLLWAMQNYVFGTGSSLTYARYKISHHDLLKNLGQCADLLYIRCIKDGPRCIARTPFGTKSAKSVKEALLFLSSEEGRCLGNFLETSELAEWGSKIDAMDVEHPCKVEKVDLGAKVKKTSMKAEAVEVPASGRGSGRGRGGRKGATAKVTDGPSLASASVEPSVAAPAPTTPKTPTAPPKHAAPISPAPHSPPGPPKVPPSAAPKQPPTIPQASPSAPSVEVICLSESETHPSPSPASGAGLDAPAAVAVVDAEGASAGAAASPVDEAVAVAEKAGRCVGRSSSCGPSGWRRPSAQCPRLPTSKGGRKRRPDRRILRHL